MKNPLITMSAITGKPTRDDVFEYLKGLKSNGIEQAMIYPRSGCEIEYLSQEWFKTIGEFIDSAKELDMAIWLYDDFNWPSGDAQGRVTAIESYRLKAIKTKGDKIGEITSKSRHNSGLFGEKYFPNLLSSDAVDYFIKCTHEEYLKRFGQHFGGTIKGIFTDEPSIGYCCEGDSIPYYDGIENDYKELCGGDFFADMKSGKECFYHNAIEVVSNRFNRCYIGKLSSWCKEHNLIMTGHLMCDNDPAGATRHGGRFLKNLSTFLMPGIDEIETDFRHVGELTLLGACEYAKGENGAMAELFALGPCDISYAKKKCMIYLTSAFKIDHYFLAVSHFDMRGNMLVKDFFSNFNTDQPDFAGTKLLAKEAKIASELAKKDFTPDVYVRYPFKECVNAIINSGNSDMVHKIINQLTYSGIQWKFIDDETVLDAPVIEFGEAWQCTLDGRKVDLSSLRVSTTIKTLDGKDVMGIFARKFNDGSLLILNLFASEGEYVIDGKTVYLDEYAVLTSLDQKTKIKEEIYESFDVKYCNNNIIRTMYINSEQDAEIYSEVDTRVRFCVRKGETAYLNGEEIKCEKTASMLSRGMKELYQMSDEITLKKGTNIVKAKNDLKYLPTVLACGEFSCSTENTNICRVRVEKRQRSYSCGDELYDFGNVELSAKILVPQGAREIRFEGAELYTQLYADERILGESITSPYDFKIDSSLWNKEITLKVVQYSSIAPIFGDVDYWDKKTENVGWRGTPSTKKHSFGFKKAFWVY